MDDFAKRLLNWHDVHGRKDLPWQQDINPYRVWLSEIMLQQTQVATVIDYFERFTQRFPTITDLAQADLDEVLHLWTGLGYYARARNLHKSANIIMSEHGGEFPDSQDDLEALPGIGRSTAGAIRAIAMRQHATILDGNVKRVLARFHAQTGYPGKTAVANQLWSYAQAHTPAQRTHTYTQAIMDLGATVCTRRNPQCAACPVRDDCTALQTGRVDELPEPKPKKDKPVRAARFFIITLPNGATLLERKPESGLWGGLWTPLERSTGQDPTELVQEMGAVADDLEQIHLAPVFRHTFTHFHLDIEPVYVTLKRQPMAVQDSDDRRWVFPELLAKGNERIGLSAPAVKLLSVLSPVFPE